MTTMVLDIGGTAIKSGLYSDGALSEISAGEKAAAGIKPSAHEYGAAHTGSVGEAGKIGNSLSIHMLNPACVILGGGVMEQSYVLEEIRAKLYGNLVPPLVEAYFS